MSRRCEVGVCDESIEVFVTVDAELLLCAAITLEKLNALLVGVELRREKSMWDLVVDKVCVLLDLLHSQERSTVFMLSLPHHIQEKERDQHHAYQ